MQVQTKARTWSVVDLEQLHSSSSLDHLVYVSDSFLPLLLVFVFASFFVCARSTCTLL